MMGLILSNRGQSGSVGFLKPKFAVANKTQSKRMTEHDQDRRARTTVRIGAPGAYEDCLDMRELLLVHREGVLHADVFVFLALEAVQAWRGRQLVLDVFGWYVLEEIEVICF